MPVKFADADYIFKTSKELLGPFKWVTRPKKNEIFDSLESRVKVSGGAARGVFFRSRIMLRWPSSMMFQLECDDASTRTHHPLYRLDINPPPHTNKFYGPEDVRGLFIEGGQHHEHIFHDSLRDDGTLREGNNCSFQARPVDIDLSDFYNARSYVCSKLNISNEYELHSPRLQGVLI